MKIALRAIAFALSLVPSLAVAQTAPATLSYHTVYGRLGATVGDTGPGQAIPFATLNTQLFNSLCQTNNAMPVYSTAQARWICTPSQTANTVLAGPTTGAAAQAAYRALVGADLPLPAASTLGGVMSKAAVASNWLRSIGTDGIPTASQPAFTDISGTIGAAQIASNTITSAMLRQGVARSVIGVTGNATANEADIQSSAANQVLRSTGTTVAFSLVPAATVQKFTTGTAATYTTPATSTYAIVKYCGGGGGGSGSGTGTTGGSGGNGGGTIFNSQTAGGGNGATASVPGTGGTATGGTENWTGSTGGVVQTGLAGNFLGGGIGGGTVLFGGASGGGVGIAGTGAGGSGGAFNGAGNSGGGGGGGGCSIQIVAGSGATYTYTIGTAGTAGTAGTSGSVGFAGSTGYLEAIEY